MRNWIRKHDKVISVSSEIMITCMRRSWGGCQKVDIKSPASHKKCNIKFSVKYSKKHEKIAKKKNAWKSLWSLKMLTTSLQKVARKLPDSCQKVARKLFESCQKVPRKNPNNCQKVARKLQKSCQKVAKILKKKKLSEICQNVVIKLPKRCQKVARKLAENCHKVVRKFLESCLNVASKLPESCLTISSKLPKRNEIVNFSTLVAALLVLTKPPLMKQEAAWPWLWFSGKMPWSKQTKEYHSGLGRVLLHQLSNIFPDMQKTYFQVKKEVKFRI